MSRHWLRNANWKRWGALLLLAGTLKLSVPVDADEPPSTSNAPAAANLAFEVEIEADTQACPALQVLQRIPYLSRLFKNTRLRLLFVLF